MVINMRKLIKIFKALSNTNRMRILKMLEVKPLCVCEITEILKLAPSTVSKHLSILRDTELILNIKDGKWVDYYLNPSMSELYVSELLSLLRKWLPDSKIINEDRKKANQIDREQICGV